MTGIGIFNRWLLVFLGIILAHLSFRQPLLAQSENYRFEHLSNEDGLSQNMVSSIIQDGKGFMWFGTKDGLNRYDGYSFKVYRNEIGDSTTISDNFITSLYLDSKRRLWVGTRNGLNLFDAKRDRFYRMSNYYSVPNEAKNNSIPRITEDESGLIWAAYEGGELISVQTTANKLQTQNFTVCTYDIDYNGESLQLLDFNIDNENRIWVGSDIGLYYANPDSSSQILKATKISGQVTRTIKNTKDFLWFGSNGSLLRIRKSDDLNKIEEINLFGDNPKFHTWLYSVNDIIEKDDSTFLIATIYGLLIFDRKSNGVKIIRERPNDVYSLSSNNLRKLYIDKSKNLWIGTGGYGINKSNLLTNRFEYYRASYGSNKTSSILLIKEDAFGDIWFTNMGSFLFKLDQNTGEAKAALLHTESQLFYDFYPLPDGTNWRLTDSLLLKYSSEQKLTGQYSSPSMHGKKIVFERIISASSNTVWVAARNAIVQFNTTSKDFSAFHYPSDGEFFVLSVYDDGSANFWVGTEIGLFNYNISTGKWQIFNQGEDGLSNDRVKSICSDPLEPNKYIWLGTDGGGLNKLDLETFEIEVFTTKDGLPNAVVYGILPDDQNNLWLSTNNGLSCFNPATGQFRNYNIHDGLQDNEFNSLSYYKDKNGKLYFGGINGITAFYPDQIKPNTYVPDVVITDFQISYESVTPGTENSPLKYVISETEAIRLDYDQRDIAFFFAAMEFSNPEKNQFRYMLEGFNENWIEAKSDHHATYTNLPHGNFIFRVLGSNNDGIFNEPGTSIRIHIARPIWKKWWAYLLYALFAGLGGFAIITYFREIRRMQHKILEEEIKAQQSAELEKIKSQFFANVSHEFRTPITLIKGRVDEMLDQVKRYDLREKIISINQNAGELLELVEEILDLVRLESKNVKLNLKSGDLVLYIHNLVQSFQPLAQSRNLTLEFYSEPETLVVEFDTYAMKKIVSNVLSNALKFSSDNGKVKVYLTKQAAKQTNNIQQSEQIIQIRVVDNGIGIPEHEQESIFKRYYQVENKEGDAKGFGLGLALVKELIDLLGGDIRVESKEKVGSAFIIELPLIPSDQASETVNLQTNSYSQENVEKLPAEHRKIIPEVDIRLQPSSSKLVLVVEDHKEMQQYIHDILNPEYKVMLAENGKTGLEMAFKETPDLIISDVKMPEMDGFEMSQRLTTDPRTSHIPIILLTAKAEVSDRLEGLEQGADDYLVKPFKKEELVIRIKNIIRKREILTKNSTGRIMVDSRFEELKSIDQEFLQKVHKIVGENIEDVQFGVEMLAKETGMSASNLYRKVQALLDITPVQLIQQLRLKRSIQLLKKGYNVSEVAWRVGFKNQANFSTSFKKQFGCSPREYLKGI